jgi:hypothetical protein
VATGLLIRRHYARVRRLTRQFERDHRWRLHELAAEPPQLDPAQPTAVFLVSSNRGVGLHTVERVEALFPGHFRNFVFVSVGIVDSESYGSEQSLRTLQYETRATLDALVNYAQVQGKASVWYDAYGNDRLVELEKLALDVRGHYPQSVFFASRLVFEQEQWWNRWLHSQTPLAMQRILNEKGVELVILPVTLRENGESNGTAAAHA